jgi:hypothetical protein
MPGQEGSCPGAVQPEHREAFEISEVQNPVLVGGQVIEGKWELTRRP